MLRTGRVLAGWAGRPDAQPTAPRGRGWFRCAVSLGVACGAGSAALETMGHAFTTLLQSRGNVVDTVDVLLLRGLMSPAGHMAWTGITAAALDALVLGVRRRPVVLRFVGAFVVVVVLHTRWDSLGSLVAYVVLAVLSLGALAVVARRLARAPQPGRPVPAAVREQSVGCS